MGHLSKNEIHKNILQAAFNRYVYIMNQLTNLRKEEIGVVEESKETNLVYVAGEEESSEDESYE